MQPIFYSRPSYIMMGWGVYITFNMLSLGVIIGKTHIKKQILFLFRDEGWEATEEVLEAIDEM